MTRRKPGAFIIGLMLSLIATKVAAQEGRTVERHIASRVLAERRTVKVNIPENYDIARRRYPVLYLLDGEQRALFDLTVATAAFNFQLDAIDHAMPSHIVVGIEQKARGVEFGKAADSFMRFVTDEMVRGIDREFRSGPLRIIAGHSLAGRFAIESLCRGSRTFSAVIAISPAIGDSASLQKIISCLTERARTDSGRVTHLFLSSGNRVKDGTEAQFRPYHLALRDWLASSAPSNIRWKFLDLPDVSHSQTPLRSIPDALAFIHDRSVWEPVPGTLDSLFAGKRVPDSTIDDFYSLLSSRAGYKVPIESKWLRIIAIIQSSQGRSTAAISTARRAIELYPEDIEAYITLADVLAQSGNKPGARKILEDALVVATRLAGSERARRERAEGIKSKIAMIQ